MPKDTAQPRADQHEKGDNLAVALDLADAGIPVFPCHESGPKGVIKAPCTPNGFKDATSDEMQIRRWWKKSPGAVPGIPTGHASGFAVLDLDLKGSKDGVAALEAMGLDPQAVVEVRTASGGWHLYYRWPEGLRNSDSKIALGVDVRGEGGYAIAPGSTMADGGRYEPVKGDLLRDADRLTAWPADLVPAEREGGGEGMGALGLSDDLLRELLSFLPNDNVEWGDWKGIMRALHEETGGSPEGFDLFCAWSEKSDKHDLVETSRQWRGLRKGLGREGNPGGGTLLMLAEQNGWHRPAVLDHELPDLLAEFDELTPEERDAIRDDKRQREPANDNEKRGIVFTDLADLEGLDVPPREWLIKDWMPWHQVTGLYGDGGTGKSLLALQLAVAVGTGSPWLGLPIDKSGDVLVIGAEDEADEMHRRFADVLDSEGLRFADCRGVKFASLFGADAVLAAADREGRIRPTPLFKKLREAVDQHRPKLVILDTLSDLFSGNANDQTQPRQFVGLLRGIALDFDCAVLLLAHPSQNGMNTGEGTFGSVGWNNALRSRLYFTRLRDDQGVEADTDARQLTSKKANYGAVGETVFLRWYRGVFIDQLDPPSNKERRNAESKFLDLLDWHSERGLPASHAKGSNYAPTIFAQHPDAGGFSPRVFAEAMNRLLSTRDIERTTERVNGKTRNILRRCDIAGEFAEDD